MKYIVVKNTTLDGWIFLLSIFYYDTLTVQNQNIIK